MLDSFGIYKNKYGNVVIATEMMGMILPLMMFNDIDMFTQFIEACHQYISVTKGEDIPEVYRKAFGE